MLPTAQMWFHPSYRLINCQPVYLTCTFLSHEFNWLNFQQYSVKPFTCSCWLLSKSFDSYYWSYFELLPDHTLTPIIVCIFHCKRKNLSRKYFRYLTNSLFDDQEFCVFTQNSSNLKYLQTIVLSNCTFISGVAFMNLTCFQNLAIRTLTIGSSPSLNTFPATVLHWNQSLVTLNLGSNNIGGRWTTTCCFLF